MSLAERGGSTLSWAGEREQHLGAGGGSQLCCRCWTLPGLAVVTSGV